jgi:hypothetical protein
MALPPAQPISTVSAGQEVFEYFSQVMAYVNDFLVCPAEFRESIKNVAGLHA